MTVENYREFGFDKAMTKVKQMENEMRVEVKFKEKHIIQRKMIFDEIDDHKKAWI